MIWVSWDIFSKAKILPVSFLDYCILSDPLQGPWVLFWLFLRRNPFLLFLKSLQRLFTAQTWTSTGQPSRWRAPPISQILSPPQPSWCWPPLLKLPAMLRFLASSLVHLASQFLLKRMSICHLTMARTPLPQCITAKVQFRQDFPTGTFLHPSSTFIISLPHPTWTARPSACWTTVVLEPSGLLPRLRKIGMGRQVVISLLSPQPNVSKAALMQRHHPTSVTLTLRVKSMTLVAPRSLLEAHPVAPWKQLRTAGKRSSPCQVSCQTERLRQAQKTALNAVSTILHVSLYIVCWVWYHTHELFKHGSMTCKANALLALVTANITTSETNCPFNT